jgi:hypothetical protein
LVLWDYAGALDMLERKEEAIQIFRGLIRRGISRMAHGRCGEGISWAKGLVNDSRYKLGLIYAGKGDYQTAKKYIRDCIASRKKGCYSIYDLREAKKDLGLILEGKDPRT